MLLLISSAFSAGLGYTDVDLLTFSPGLGYADVENRVRMCPETVLRIASISKPITMAAIAKQWETGKLDLDKPVQYYVPTFPEKRVNDVAVMDFIYVKVQETSHVMHNEMLKLRKKNILSM